MRTVVFAATGVRSKAGLTDLPVNTCLAYVAIRRGARWRQHSAAGTCSDYTESVVTVSS